MCVSLVQLNSNPVVWCGVIGLVEVGRGYDCQMWAVGDA